MRCTVGAEDLQKPVSDIRADMGVRMDLHIIEEELSDDPDDYLANPLHLGCV